MFKVEHLDVGCNGLGILTRKLFSRNDFDV